MLHKADLKAGNDLLLRIIVGKLFLHSICLQKKKPDNTLLVKRICLTIIGEECQVDVSG